MKQLGELDIVPVVLWKGQSNNSGRGDLDDLIASIYRDPLRASVIWNETQLEILRPGVGVAPGNLSPFDDVFKPLEQHGMEISFAREWESRYRKGAAHFKLAISGTPLTDGPSQTIGQWRPAANQIWHTAVREWKRFIKALKEAYNKPVRAELLVWCQGETDATFAQTNPGLYKTEFYLFLDAVYALTGNPDLKVVIVPPSSFIPDSIASMSHPLHTVRYEQIEVALERDNVAMSTCYFPDFWGADPYAFTFDGTHYTSDVLRKEGQRIAHVYNKMLSGDVAPSPVTSLVASPLANSVTLAWDPTGSREVVVVDAATGKLKGTSRQNSIVIDGLDPATNYTFDVYTHNSAWGVVSASINTTTTGVVMSDEEADLIALYGGDEAAIAVAVKARYKGSRHGGGAGVALAEPDWVNSPYITLPYLGKGRIPETQFEVQRLSIYDTNTPANGNADNLRSERQVHMAKQIDGDFYFFDKNLSLKLVLYMIDVSAQEPQFIKQVDFSGYSSDEIQWAHPHPTESDLICLPQGSNWCHYDVLQESTTVVSVLPFAPDLGSNTRDGNGMRNGYIMVKDAASNEWIMLNVVTGDVVDFVAGVNVDVPVANRPIFSLPAPGATNGLDYAWTDGELIYCMIKGTAGPNGGSGLFAYQPNGVWTGVNIFTRTGHYGIQPSVIGAFTRSVIAKNGGANVYGGFDPGDGIEIKYDLTYNGSAWVYTDQAQHTYTWTYTNNNPSGGQYSGIEEIPDVSYVTMQGAFSTSSGQNLGNKIQTTFLHKETIMEFELDQPNNWCQIGRTLTTANGLDRQTEINFLGEGPDGTRYLLHYTGIGPVDGDPSSPDLLSEKDWYLIIRRRRMSDDRIAYYLGL